MPVQIADIMSENEKAEGIFRCPMSGESFEPHERAFPAYYRVPMGWSWAVYVAVDIITREVEKGLRQLPDLSWRSLNRPVDELQPIRLQHSEVAVGSYIDNIFSIGANREVVAATQEALHQHMDNVGLVIGDVHPVQRALKEVGVLFDGESNTISHPIAKTVTLRKAALFLASQRRMRGDTVQVVLGHFTWAFSINRPLYSIFGAAYKFVEMVGNNWARSWPSVQRELRIAARLLLFADAALGRPVCDVCVCSDAEGVNAADNGGGAVVACELSTETATRFLCDTSMGTTPGVSNSKFVKFTTKQRWHTVEQRRWRFPAHVNILELEALLLGVKRVGRTGLARGGLLCAMTDSSTAFYSVRKGRSSKLQLRRLLQRLACVLLVHDLRLSVQWVPTDYCPADAPSREKSAYAAEIVRRARRRAYQEWNIEDVSTGL